MLRCTKQEMFQNIFWHGDQADAGPDLFFAGVWLVVRIRLATDIRTLRPTGESRLKVDVQVRRRVHRCWLRADIQIQLRKSGLIRPPMTWSSIALRSLTLDSHPKVASVTGGT